MSYRVAELLLRELLNHAAWSLKPPKHHGTTHLAHWCGNDRPFHHWYCSNNTPCLQWSKFAWQLSEVSRLISKTAVPFCAMVIGQCKHKTNPLPLLLNNLSVLLHNKWPFLACRGGGWVGSNWLGFNWRRAHTPEALPWRRPASSDSPFEWRRSLPPFPSSLSSYLTLHLSHP